MNGFSSRGIIGYLDSVRFNQMTKAFRQQSGLIDGGIGANHQELFSPIACDDIRSLPRASAFVLARLENVAKAPDAGLEGGEHRRIEFALWFNHDYFSMSYAIRLRAIVTGNDRKLKVRSETGWPVVDWLG